MPADVLDPTNPQINAVLLDFRAQLREAVSSGRYGDWEGRAVFQPRHLFEVTSGNLYKKRLTVPKQKS